LKPPFGVARQRLRIYPQQRALIREIILTSATSLRSKRNVFGGSLGGPIKKDKTFLFGNYEGFRQKLGLSDLTLVPDSTSRAAAVASRLRSSRIQSRRNHDCFPARSIREEFIAFTSFSALF
jgi:hypothetical protein